MPVTFPEVPTERQALARRQEQADPRDRASFIDPTWYRLLVDEARAVRELQTAFPVTIGALGVGVTPAPTITFGGAAVGLTYGSQFLRTYQLGPIVFFTLALVLTNKGVSVGNALISGLPVAASSEANHPCANSFTAMTAGVGDTMCRAVVLASSATIQLGKIVAGSYIQLNDADFTNTSNLRIDGMYFTAP